MKKCPRCESPSPSRHPAIAFEGEVEVCTHPYHAPGATADVREDALRKLRRDIEAWAPAVRDAEHYFDIDGSPIELHALVRKEPDWAANRIREERRLREASEAENALLTEVLNRARFALLASIKGTPEQANDAMGALSLACRAHWDWQTTRISNAQSAEGDSNVR